MDERTKQELEAVEALLEHPGWAVLMRQTQEKIDAFKRDMPFNLKTVEDLYTAKGVLAALQAIMATADLCAASRASYEAPAEQEDEYAAAR